MNVLIYTADLSQHNKHLMPWRTVIEVAKHFIKSGHETTLYSGLSDGVSDINAARNADGVIAANGPKPFSPKNRAILINFIRQQHIEALYFPIAFARDYSRLVEIEQASSCLIIWYIPGGWYSVRQSAKAMCHIGVRAALPYLLQALIPKKFFFRRLGSTGSRNIIAMTEYTAENLLRSGYGAGHVFHAPPGKAPLAKSNETPECYPHYSNLLFGVKYFLFFGPPSPIRGIKQILKAFSTLIDQEEKCKLVCLFRGDQNVDSYRIRKEIETYAFGDRIVCVWSSVNGADLELFLKNCFAVLKPFLIVPSEIPLAILETAGHGKPVIGTGPDGTGHFVSKFGLTVPHADSKALTDAMLKLINDQQLYESKCANAINLYEAHPDWESVAKIWLRAAYR